VFDLLLSEDNAWNYYRVDRFSVWFKGHLSGSVSLQQVITKLDLVFELSAGDNYVKLKRTLSEIRGNYGLVVCCDEWSLAFTDRLRSVPIFYSISDAQTVLVSNHVNKIKCAHDADRNCAWDPDSVLSFAMSGYTIGRKTLLKEVKQIAAGECIVLKNKKIDCFIYYNYTPWHVECRSNKVLSRELLDTNLEVLSDMVAGIEGRQIVVPLSAGFDSRLVVSGLKKLGVKDVVCFAYGRAGNYESKISRALAEKLGYPWLFIPVTNRSQAKFFESEVYQNYLDMFDSFSSVPAVQDISEVINIRDNALVSSDAVFVNGNSGDFISGGHIIHGEKVRAHGGIDLQELYLDEYYNKHYSLWGCLKNEATRDFVVSEIKRLIVQRDLPNIDNFDNIPAIMESIEYVGRQTMYVINQQNAYEFAGYDWRLPLWDNKIMDFWSTVPIENKIEQSLYRETLINSNMADVWKSIPLNHKKIYPYTLRYARMLTKILSAPLGKNKWHTLERNLFTYWLDPSGNSAIIPYSKALLDFRGQRHFVSWLADQYLIEHGIGKISRRLTEHLHGR